MRERAEGGAGGGFLTFVAIYGLWLFTGVLAFAVCISWQTTLQRIYLALGFNKYGLAAFTYLVLIALVVAWLTIVVLTETWYRRAAEEGRLLRRGVWVLGSLFALVAVAMLTGRLV